MIRATSAPLERQTPAVVQTGAFKRILTRVKSAFSHRKRVVPVDTTHVVAAPAPAVDVEPTASLPAVVPRNSISASSRPVSRNSRASLVSQDVSDMPIRPRTPAPAMEDLPIRPAGIDVPPKAQPDSAAAVGAAAASAGGAPTSTTAVDPAVLYRDLAELLGPEAVAEFRFARNPGLQQENFVLCRGVLTLRCVRSSRSELPRGVCAGPKSGLTAKRS